MSMKKLTSVLFETFMLLAEDNTSSKDVLYADETMIINKSSSIRVYHIIPADRSFGPIKLELSKDPAYLVAYAKGDMSLVQLVPKSTLSELFKAELNVSVIDGIIQIM